MKHSSGACTAALSSLTYAMKAQRILNDVQVSSSIVKLDSSRTSSGCAYGVTYPCERSDTVKRALKAGAIGVRAYITGGGESI